MTAEPPVVDIFDRAFWQREPHDAWTWCRAHDPVHRDERSGIWCITKNVDMKTAQIRLGHTDPALTLRIYAQATTEGDRAAAALIDDYFAAVTRPSL